MNKGALPDVNAPVCTAPEAAPRLKWRKVTGWPKWGGYENGKHVASICLVDDEWRIWVGDGSSFSRAHHPDFAKLSSTTTAKMAAEEALAAWRVRKPLWIEVDLSTTSAKSAAETTKERGEGL